MQGTWKVPWGLKPPPPAKIEEVDDPVTDPPSDGDVGMAQAVPNDHHEEEVTSDTDHEDEADWGATDPQCRPVQNPFNTKELMEGMADTASPVVLVSAEQSAAYEGLLPGGVSEPNVELEGNLEGNPPDPFSGPKVILRSRAEVGHDPPPTVGVSTEQPVADEDDEFQEGEIQ